MSSTHIREILRSGSGAVVRSELGLRTPDSRAGLAYQTVECSQWFGQEGTRKYHGEASLQGLQGCNL